VPSGLFGVRTCDRFERLSNGQLDRRPYRVDKAWVENEPGPDDFLSSQIQREPVEPALTAPSTLRGVAAKLPRQRS
jgi:hypothetical protein